MRVAQYLRQYFRPDASAVVVEESRYLRDDMPLRAVIYRPADYRKLPAWVVLHGLTATGADHPSLKRFASALAAAGHVVLIPEIVEWSKLLVTPSLTAPTIEASIEVLHQRVDVDVKRIGIFGFSFGATHAIAAAHRDVVADNVKALVAWGGYADLRRVVRFGVTGEHEIDGKKEVLDPDPYGRWMFGGNYLTKIPGYENMQRVQHALLELAREAGRSGVYAGDPVHRATASRLRESLGAEERRVFELFAPIEKHDKEGAKIIGDQLAEAIIRVDPDMDPGDVLEQTRVPVTIAHGRDDRLVPYTEGVRLRRRIPDDMLRAFTVTDLFSHSGGNGEGIGSYRAGA